VVPCVVRAHARASAAFVRACAGADGRGVFGSAPKWLGLAAPGLLRAAAAAFRALQALKDCCWPCLVLVVLLLLVRDVVLSVRPDVRA
jgi:hypothetical protein